jgi:hypothetical protein
MKPDVIGSAPFEHAPEAGLTPLYLITTVHLA